MSVGDLPARLRDHLVDNIVTAELLCEAADALDAAREGEQIVRRFADAPGEGELWSTLRPLRDDARVWVADHPLQED